MKNNNFLLGVLLFFLIPFCAYSASKHSHKSKYVGQEKREIKSLSESDIEELENGKGWGFAKAAELNGVPGPIHLLEMKKEIRLSSEQIQKMENMATKFGSFCKKMKEDNQENITKINNFFLNLKEKFEDGFNPQEEEQEDEDEILE